MAKVNSTMLPLGTQAPSFSLYDPEGNLFTLDHSSKSNAFLVMFICNHCPFVHHIRKELARLANDYIKRDVSIIAINSNDYETHPGDSPEKMKDEIMEWGYNFPYLVDEDQSVAIAYQASCTPDFFLFDSQQQLVYRGQLDGGRPSNDIPVNGRDIRAALDTLLAGDDVSEEQVPSVGCNIKWKPNNSPEWFN
ncbi:uncharacterized protein METZ01_LOCUS40091 [marine metagenome]|mgnify:FL=1|jgi:thiol-disulfide isomerase/thioredoxin|uniref:Thioredoxin domain-containing protein n=1 Tax=marine metagenome TaxID=408172 RepID=A0A381RBM0_9ZZZZ|tara:strand:- start:128 stop:706 length:579 start_codon:yes stop_codon:yes gene_type:complete